MEHVTKCFGSGETSVTAVAGALAITLCIPAFYDNLGVTAVEFLVAAAMGGIMGTCAGLALGANRFLAAAHERWVHY